MRQTMAVILGAGLLAIALQSTGHAADPEQSYQAGETLLADGDLSGALKKFAEAARADLDNQQYLQQYAVLRQALMIRGALDQDMDDARWETMARALHAFYIDHRLYPQALVLDKRIHARLDTAYTALMVAETQLAMNKAAEAAQVLADLDEAKQTAASKAVRAVALARLDRLEEAKRLGDSIQLSDGAGPATIYAVARCQAAIGDTAEACQSLARCFEGVAPSVLDGFKEHAKECPEFVSLVETPAFANVLKTESKVPESKCSGGTACSTCPMRGNCSGH